MESRIYESDLFRCEIIDGIAIVNLKQGQALTLEKSKQMVSERLKFFDGISYPVVIDLNDIKYTDKEARAYLNKEGLAGMKAGALITNSTAAKIFFNLFLSIGKPLIPSKIFTSKSEAITWLKMYR